MSAAAARASAEALAKSRRTIASYEGYAHAYDRLVAKVPSAFDADALRRLAAALPRGGRVLEIGSGPGREADFVESLGLKVRRTDATQAFLDLQAARGRRATRLNVLTDRLGGPYDGVLAMCVLIHVDRGHVDLVLRKIARALRHGGAFLVSMREGRGERTGAYHTIYWRRRAFAEHLEVSGLQVAWHAPSVDTDGDPWLTFLATKGTAIPRGPRPRRR